MKDSEESNYKLKSGFIHDRLTLLLIPPILAIIIIVLIFLASDTPIREIIKWESILLLPKLGIAFTMFTTWGFVILGIGLFVIGIPSMIYVRWRSNRMWSNIAKDKDENLKK